VSKHFREPGTQLILAAATMPTNIEELLQQIIDTSTLEHVVSPNLHKLMRHIPQKFVRMNKSDRPAFLLELAKSETRKNRPLIIFGNKSSTSDYISIFLNDNGVDAINLNGDMQTHFRVGRFEKFQDGLVNVLATTDVASRGLDTTRVKHILNFDFPLHAADYIHRCGRAGRMGSATDCYVTNVVSSQREIELVQKIEHAARTNGLLQDVNANITNIIRRQIMKDLAREQQAANN
jgi:ATP-dependent RNA helicase DDX28